MSENRSTHEIVHNRGGGGGGVLGWTGSLGAWWKSESIEISDISDKFQVENVLHELGGGRRKRKTNDNVQCSVPNPMPHNINLKHGPRVLNEGWGAKHCP